MKPISLRLKLTIQVAAVFAITVAAVFLIGRAELRDQLSEDANNSAAAALAAYIGAETTSGGLPIHATIDDLARFLYVDASGDEVSQQEFGNIMLGALDEQLSSEIGQNPPNTETLNNRANIAVETIEFPSPIQTSGPSKVVLRDDTPTLLQPVKIGPTELSVGVTIPQRPIANSLAAATTLGAVLIPILTALVAAATWITTSRALRPVEAIRTQVSRTDPTHLQRHVPRSNNNDEIDRLAATMNTMLDRLHEAGEQQRRFISDASHELRSPITATITALETTRSSTIETSWPQLSNTILDRQRRLATLVDDLLLLATLDEHRPQQRSQIDLDELALTVAAQASTPGIAVQAIIEFPHRIHGDPQLLHRCFTNIVDNAVRHATSAVTITITREAASKRPVAMFDDDGPGISASDHETIFGRFTRLDESRTPSTGGAGLGLSIARTIAADHNATLIASTSPQGGARFEVKF